MVVLQFEIPDDKERILKDFYLNLKQQVDSTPPDALKALLNSLNMDSTGLETFEKFAGELIMGGLMDLIKFKKTTPTTELIFIRGDSSHYFCISYPSPLSSL